MARVRLKLREKKLGLENSDSNLWSINFSIRSFTNWALGPTMIVSPPRSLVDRDSGLNFEPWSCTRRDHGSTEILDRSISFTNRDRGLNYQFMFYHIMFVVPTWDSQRALIPGGPNWAVLILVSYLLKDDFLKKCFASGPDHTLVVRRLLSSLLLFFLSSLAFPTGIVIRETRDWK